MFWKRKENPQRENNEQAVNYAQALIDYRTEVLKLRKDLEEFKIKLRNEQERANLAEGKLKQLKLYIDSNV